jgi:ankyrin repeat protein
MMTFDAHARFGHIDRWFSSTACRARIRPHASSSRAEVACSEPLSLLYLDNDWVVIFNPGRSRGSHQTFRLVDQRRAFGALLVRGKGWAHLVGFRIDRGPRRTRCPAAGCLALLDHHHDIAVKVNRIDMVSLLLDLGLDPNEPVEEVDGGIVAGAPLWFASMCGRYQIAELLITRGADVNAVLNGNGDAMCCAETTGDEPMQALLRRHGARLTVECVAGHKDRETARAILEGRIPGTSLNVEEPTLIDLAEQMLWAAGSCDAEIVRMCLPYMTRRPEDPWWNYVLMHATLPECFQLVLDHGVDPDVTGVGGHTTLHHLATNTAGDEHRITRAALLLDASASLQKRDQLLKSTPLGWACRWGRVDLVELYLSRGADPREPDAEPWATPLAWATKCGNQSITELLRSHGAK